MMESQISELLDFCRRHPVERVDPERFIRHLSSPPLSLIDFRSKGWLGVIMDRAPDVAGAAPFEWVGASAENLEADIAEKAVKEIIVRARGLKLPSVHIMLTSHWRGAEGLLDRVGGLPLYHDLEMTHADAGWGLDMPLQDGWRWVSVTPEREEEYIGVLRRSFGRQVGLYMPSAEDLIKGLRDPEIVARALLNAQERLCALMRCRPKRRYIHAVGRDPEFQGLGLGQMAMDEARRVLGAGPIHLSVVKENRRAVNLYTRLGFAVESEMQTWSLPIS